MGRDSTTLYLRGMPAHLVREAKAAAARRGMTLTRLVADALERASQGSEGPGEPAADDFDLDMEWYKRNRSRLVRRYESEYVAILDGRVIDHDRDFEALAGRVFKQVGVRPVFMPHVSAEEPRAHVRSPRRRSA